MAIDILQNVVPATVTSGGTTAPAAGTVQTWTVSASGWPTTTTGITEVRIVDQVALPLTTGYEIILVTNISGSTWTVIRGADGTTPTTHIASFTVVPVVTSAGLDGRYSPPAIFQDARRRGASVQTLLAEGVTHWAVAANITNASTTITVTSTLNPPVGSSVTIAGSTGFTTNNPNGTWIVTAVTATTYTAVVTNAPTGSYTANQATVRYVAPIVDVVIGDSIPFGEGAGPNGISGVGYTDNQTVLKTMENRASGFPDPGRGFRRCNAPFFSSDTWANLAVGSAVSASGPCATFNTSWQLTTTGQVIGDTQVFRRAVVFFKRRATGDGVQVSFNGGSTFTATLDTHGSGYFMVDSGDLGTIQPRTLQVAWEAHIGGSGGGGVEVAGYRLYQTEGYSGAYNDVLAASGTTAQQWVANTDWDTYWLPMVQPRRVLICLGVNDLAVAGRTLAQLQGDLTSLVTRAQAAAPLAEIVLVAEYHPGNIVNSYNTGITGANWGATYVAMVQGIAQTYGCTFIDLFARVGDVSVRVGDSGDPYGLTQTGGTFGALGDGVHLGDTTASTSGVNGQRMLAETYREKLGLSLPYNPVAAPGWRRDPLPWTFIGGGVFSTPGNYSLDFPAGTKRRWSESGVVKYGVVSGCAYSGGLTLMAMGANSDYPVAASPDTSSAWYSYGDPPDFPHVFNFGTLATFTGTTGGTYVAQWSVNNGWCELNIINTSTATGTGTGFTVSNLPFDAGAIAYGSTLACLDGGSPCSAIAVFAPASSVVTFLKNTIAGTASWTASGPRELNGIFRYPI